MTDEEYRQKAREQYGKDGDIEIDEDADVSREHDHRDEDGAYVQAWVWVAHSTDPPIRQPCWQCHEQAPTEDCGRCSDCCGTAKDPNKSWSTATAERKD